MLTSLCRCSSLFLSSACSLGTRLLLSSSACTVASSSRAFCSSWPALASSAGAASTAAAWLTAQFQQVVAGEDVERGPARLAVPADHITFTEVAQPQRAGEPGQVRRALQLGEQRNLRPHGVGQLDIVAPAVRSAAGGMIWMVMSSSQARVIHHGQIGDDQGLLRASLQLSTVRLPCHRRGAERS